MVELKMKDSSGSFYVIYGKTSYYLGGELSAYISKHGHRHVWGPIIKTDMNTHVEEAYTFSFMAPKPTDEQMRFLHENTIEVYFECDEDKEI